jgi:hypothetical protein
MGGILKGVLHEARTSRTNSLTIWAPALAPVAVAPAADAALSRSSPSVSVATNSDKALKEQRIATAILPAARATKSSWPVN